MKQNKEDFLIIRITKELKEEFNKLVEEDDTDKSKKLIELINLYIQLKKSNKT